MDEIVTYDPYVTRKVGPWVFDVSLADPNKVGGNTGDGWDVTVPGSGAWKVRIDSIDAVDPAFTYDLDARSHVGGATVIVDEDGVDVAYTTMDSAGSGFPYWCRYTFGDIRNGGRDTFEKIGTTVGGVMFDGFGVYDSKRGMMYRNSVRMSGNTADILALRVKGATGVTGTTPIQLIDELGADFPLNVWNAAATPPQFVRECFYGATYDAENDRLWLWNGDVSAPGRLYYVQLPDWTSGTGWASTTWTVHAVTPAGATPRGNHEHGILGKMQAVPALGAFVVLDSTTIDRVEDPAVWLFKTSAQNNLSVSGSAQGNASTSVAITRTQDLAGANCSQANTGSAGAISIDSGLDLTAANAAQANEGTGGAITINGALIAAPSVQENIAAASAIVQAHILAAASSSQSNAGSSASIGVGDPIILEVSMSSQANDCSTGEISTSITFASDPRFISAARPRGYTAGIVH